MGGETNTIYRPDPAKANLDPNEVPVWDEDFYGNYGNQWTVKMAYDPKGVDDKGNEKLPTLGDQSACNATQCEELSTGELQELWKTYGAKFDGIFKRSNGNYYFFRNHVNEDPPNPKICEGGVNLAESLTKAEAGVLEIWTSLSEHDLARCETASDGGGSYKVVLKDGEPKKIRDELDQLIKALEWKQENPGKTENPHNPQGLPLNISLEQAKKLRVFFDDQGTAWYEKPLNLVLTGVGLLVGGYLTGLGFAAAGEHIKKWWGGGGDGTHTGGVAPLTGTSDYDRDVTYTEVGLERVPFKMGDNCGTPRLRLVVKERTHYGNNKFKSVDFARGRMGFPPMQPSKPLLPEEVRAVADWINTLSPSSEPKGSSGLVARK